MADIEAQGFAPVPGPHDAELPGLPAAVNGHLDHEDPAPEGVAEELDAADDAGEDAAEEELAEEAAVPAVAAKPAPPKTERIYFVRLPKPDLSDDDIAIEKIKAEFNSHKEGCDLLLATLKVERVKQDEAKRDFEAADLVFQESRAAQDKWREQLEPLRNANKLVTDQRAQMKDNFRELSARTEAELDKMIEDIEFSMSHETLNVQEEKKLIAQLKKLEQSRPRVRTAEAAMLQLEQSKEHLDDFRQHKQELEKKLDMIRAEVNEAKEVKGARYAVLKAVRARTNQLADELTAMRAAKDAKWDELNRMRDARKAKLDQYYENRRFSQTVRSLLASGAEGVADAKAQCEELNGRLVAQLLEDAEFRAEYLNQWDLQRKYSVTLADLALDTAPQKKAASKLASNGAVPSGKTRAQDIISALMAEADEELGLAPPVASTSTAKSVLPTSHAATNGHAAAAPAAAAAAVEIPGHSEAATRPKPSKPRAEKAKPAPPPPDVQAVFEEYAPPPKAAPSAAELTPEQQRAAIREEQRLKAQEAEERKRKREESKVKKSSKAAELAKQKEEEEELKAELERERIRREADEQRRRDARRKEEAARKASASKGGAKNSKHSPQVKEVAAAKKPKVKLTLQGRVLKFASEYQSLLSIGAVVLVLFVVMVLATQMS